MFRLSIIRAFPFQHYNLALLVFISIPSFFPFDSFPSDLLLKVYISSVAKAKFETIGLFIWYHLKSIGLSVRLRD